MTTAGVSFSYSYLDSLAGWTAPSAFHHTRGAPALWPAPGPFSGLAPTALCPFCVESPGSHQSRAEGQNPLPPLLPTWLWMQPWMHTWLSGLPMPTAGSCPIFHPPVPQVLSLCSQSIHPSARVNNGDFPNPGTVPCTWSCSASRGSLLKPVKVCPGDIPALKHVNFIIILVSSIHLLRVYSLPLFLSLIKPLNRISPLRDTPHYWFPLEHWVIHCNSLDVATQALPSPSHSPSIKIKSLF